MYLFIIGYTLVLAFATGVSHTVVEISKDKRDLETSRLLTANILCGSVFSQPKRGGARK